MRILAYSSNSGGHDGTAVLLENGRLVHSLENEKDSGPRFSQICPTLFVRSLQFTEHPDVVALDALPKSGLKLWFLERMVDDASVSRVLVEANYSDETVAAKFDSETLFAGRMVRQFSSSHARCHIMCSYGLSPFPQGEPCYVLIWEGFLGTMYYVDENVSIKKVGDVLAGPGTKYTFLYALADPTIDIHTRHWERMEDPGKLMSLAAYGRRGAPTPEQQEIMSDVMSLSIFQLYWDRVSPKSAFSGSRFCNIGVESQDLKDLAWQISAALFDRFYQFAKEHVTQRVPLIIGGGCGLNCEWNTQWRECGLFSDVFVPPCTNDSGLAIGAAIDALHHYTGRAKIDWSVYAGEPFIEDVTASSEFDCSTLNLVDVCRRLLKGDVIAWVQGRYEIGPRALGNRSLIAAPFSPEIRDRLNRIKQREAFRPIAPICLEEDFGRHFEHSGSSPHMLFFQRVKSPELAGITHVDGSARAQTVNDAENPLMCDLLREFRRQSGFPVLCNTSLNFKGCGFINRLSNLFSFAREHGIDGLAVGANFWHLRRGGGH